MQYPYEVRPCVRQKFPNFLFSRVTEKFDFRTFQKLWKKWRSTRNSKIAKNSFQLDNRLKSSVKSSECRALIWRTRRPIELIEWNWIFFDPRLDPFEMDFILLQACLPLLMAVVCQVMINYKATPTVEYGPRTLVLSDYEVSNEKMIFYLYSVFHRFRQAKFAYGGLILSSSQFTLLPQRSLKMILALKVDKIDLKIIILIPLSVKQTVINKSL